MKRNERIISFMLILCLMLTLVPTNVFAQEQEAQSTSNSVEDNSADSSTDNITQEYEEQANSWRYSNGEVLRETQYAWSSMLRAKSFTPWTWSDSANGYLSSDGTVIEKAVRKGIDVSHWNGNIDWKKVKESGVDFAIIRCGYGDDVDYQDDDYWVKNIEACEKYDIPYGVYIYSYAVSDENVESEIQHVLRCLKEVNASPDYPVYYDLEDKVVAECGKENIIKWAMTFCKAIEKAGYTAGIYANLNWWNNYLNDDSLDKYEKWVAQWNDECTYTDLYSMWQCTSDGSVSGITGRVDINFEMDFIAPTLSKGVGVRDNETTASIQFTSDEATTLYYSVVEVGATAPTIDTTGTGIACVSGKNNVSITNLMGLYAKDIYILLKDVAGNSSNTLKITVPTVDYSISSNTTAISFEGLQMGYTASVPQTITITNTSLNPVTLTQPSAQNYSLGLLSATVLAPNETATFTIQPNVGLLPGSYNETITVWGDNGVSAQIEASFKVDKASITEKKVTLSATSYAYDGKSKKPTVKSVEGLTTSDYTVTYKDSAGKTISSAKYPGTYQVVITGKGNYTGTITKTFKIKKPVVAAQKKVTVSLYGYDDIKVIWSSQKITGATVKYKVEYKKNDGKWKTLTSGTKSTSIKKANLEDGAKYTFRVTPYVKVNGVTYTGTAKKSSIYTLKKISTPTITKASSKYIKIKWTNISGESGYEIARSTKKKSDFKVIKTVSSKSKSLKIKATNNKTYYYKIRAYKKVNGKKIYGPWSSVKSFKLK